MALTGYGFTGVQAAYEDFEDKAPRVIVGQSPRPSRYRYRYRLTSVTRLLVLWVLGGL